MNDNPGSLRICSMVTRRSSPSRPNSTKSFSCSGGDRRACVSGSRRANDGTPGARGTRNPAPTACSDKCGMKTCPCAFTTAARNV
ncbi:Uncharacterised protein [uncultured archaeon]|nr:Uncharacterised protein [uncultured archaeon]